MKKLLLLSLLAIPCTTTPMDKMREWFKGWAYPNRVEKCGLTPLQQAALYEPNPERLERLLMEGGDPNLSVKVSYVDSTGAKTAEITANDILAARWAFSAPAMKMSKTKLPMPYRFWKFIETKGVKEGLIMPVTQKVVPAWYYTILHRCGVSRI